MMRFGDSYGLAVRCPDGKIRAGRLPWFSLLRRPWLKKPFIRGFPILLETLINGIRALNRSVEVAAQSDGEELSAWELLLSLGLAVFMAVALFVVAPHLLSLIMLWMGMGGDVEGLSFHIWDGFYKCCIFMGYIWLISCVPDIRRVFQYHGAEHKIIHAYESEGEISSAMAKHMSRLHPRCGTTFLLFVICISIVLHAVLLPMLLFLYTPASALVKHALTVAFKLALMVPISALAYELIRHAARLPDGLWASILRAPGLTLQRLTTYEPDDAQLEVALVALHAALGPNGGEQIRTSPYEKWSA